MRVIAVLGLIALISACSPKRAHETAEAEPSSAPPPSLVEVPAPLPPDVVTPARGDPLRKLLLDSVRAEVVATLGVPVEFKVDELRVSGDWAFAVLQPLRPGGGPISIAETKLKDEEGEWDGLRTEAIWRMKDGVWVLTEHAIGATDVWHEPYCDTAPKGLIPICANRSPKS